MQNDDDSWTESASAKAEGPGTQYSQGSIVVYFGVSVSASILSLYPPTVTGGSWVFDVVEDAGAAADNAYPGDSAKGSGMGLYVGQKASVTVGQDTPNDNQGGGQLPSPLLSGTWSGIQWKGSSPIWNGLVQANQVTYTSIGSFTDPSNKGSSDDYGSGKITGIFDNLTANITLVANN